MHINLCLPHWVMVHMCAHHKEILYSLRQFLPMKNQCSDMQFYFLHFCFIYIQLALLIHEFGISRFDSMWVPSPYLECLQNATVNAFQSWLGGVLMHGEVMQPPSSSEAHPPENLESCFQLPVCPDVGLSFRRIQHPQRVSEQILHCIGVHPLYFLSSVLHWAMEIISR